MDIGQLQKHGLFIEKKRTTVLYMTREVHVHSNTTLVNIEIILK